jgi:hypothetical protein
VTTKTTTTQFFVFTNGNKTLIKVIDHAMAYRFTDRWVRADSFASKVSGMGGDANFEDVTEDEAKKLFPLAFP